MKITDEYIAKNLELAQKNLEFCREKGWKELAAREEGAVAVWEQLQMRRFLSGRRICWLDVENKFKKRLIKFLSGIIDYLRGVESHELCNPSRLERMAREKTRNTKKRFE